MLQNSVAKSMPCDKIDASEITAAKPSVAKSMYTIQCSSFIFIMTFRPIKVEH